MLPAPWLAPDAPPAAAVLVVVNIFEKAAVVLSTLMLLMAFLALAARAAPALAACAAAAKLAVVAAVAVDEAAEEEVDDDVDRPDEDGIGGRSGEAAYGFSPEGRGGRWRRNRSSSGFCSPALRPLSSSTFVKLPMSLSAKKMV